MTLRPAGTRRVAGYLEAGAHLLGNVTQDAGQLLLRSGGLSDLPLAIGSSAVGLCSTAANTLAATIDGVSNYWNINSAGINENALIGANAGILLQGPLRVSAIIAPSFGAAQNNWNPTGLSTCQVIRASCTVGGGPAITGITAPASGYQRIVLLNVGANFFTITNEDAASTAANRILTATGATLSVAVNGIVFLEYDSTTSRWRAGMF